MTTQTETRRYEATHGVATMGRAPVYIICPFCGVKVTAYLWSLAGRGKRCPCGAKFDAYGTAVKKVPANE